MRLVVDTGVFSAALSRRRRQLLDSHVEALLGNQLFLSVVTVAELRYGAIVADWGSPRRERVEAAIAATTVVPVTDALLSTMAELRAACRRLGHPLADPVHGNDLWIAATALHIGAALATADQIFVGVPALVLVP
ncbi:MAG: PIN domain-containing protein [Ilumatobacteraceae bacterium]